MNAPAKNSIIELRSVCHSYKKPSGEPLLVLDAIDAALREGEILGLLGRSGSGKSTLLRIAAGLIQPTSGEVIYRGSPLRGPSAGISVVFQSFALYPWLSVERNVDAGLDALRLPRAEAHRRTASAIDLIGLDGFQSAYPRELSGGMRQRVGFARAIVADPIALLMDEPFSALDVLTAETLRTDFLDLWIGRKLPLLTVLLVTHNIEEAVLMCDRILVLSSNPGRVCAQMPIPLAHPRDRLGAEFRAIVDEIYSILTLRSLETLRRHAQPAVGMALPLPLASVNQISGLLEKLLSPPYGGHIELPELARTLALEVDDLFPIAEATHILGFAQLTGRSLKLTAAGKLFAAGTTEERKRLWREHLLQFVPLASHIHRVLGERQVHWAPRSRFETELEDHLTRQEATRTLRAVTGWGRYAELFSYDAKLRRFTSSR